MNLQHQLDELERVPRHLSPARARVLSRTFASLPRSSEAGVRNASSDEMLALRAARLRSGEPHPDDSRIELHVKLMRAIASADPAACEAVLAAGAPVNGVFGAGPPPLHFAVLASADTDDNRCLALLLRQPGIDVNAAGRAGETPLHVAAASGRTEAVRLLLDAGANPTLRDYAGRTPRELLERQFVAGAQRFPTLCSFLERAETQRSGRVVSQTEETLRGR